MFKSVSLHAYSHAKRLAFAALFAALCCIATVLIVVPLPNGYFNTGDVFVLLSGWCLGPVYGTFAAAIGSALADVLSGYAIYAPATLLIKGTNAFIAYLVCAFLKKYIIKEALDFLPRLISALTGELLMVGGYFLFEYILYGFSGATVAVVGNLLQGACCLGCAVAIFSALYPIKAVRKFFPALSSEK